MNRDNTSLFESTEVINTARNNPKDIPSIVKRHFYELKARGRKEHFSANNERKSSKFLFNNDYVPPGAVLVFYGITFAAMYRLYMRPGGRMLFSWTQYFQHSGKRNNSYFRNYSSSEVPHSSQQRYGRCRSGDMTAGEVDFARRHMVTLGMSTLKLDNSYSSRVLCEKEVKGAFAKISLRTHPDTFDRSASDFERKESLQKFHAASAAYNELKHFIKCKNLAQR